MSLYVVNWLFQRSGTPAPESFIITPTRLSLPTIRFLVAIGYSSFGIRSKFRAYAST